LRQYALHSLFMPPAPSPGIAGTDAQAPARNIFPFHRKPNTLDRDHIVVPAGWDSWGKISVLRDGFDAKSWGEAWERDLDVSQADEEPGAKKLYSILVPDQGPKPHPLPPFNNPMPEQAFLAKHYDENAKKPDSRTSSGNPADLAGVVGPLQSISFSLPNVDRALSDMETGIGAPVASSTTNADGRRLGPRSSNAGPRPAGLGASISRPATATSPIASPSPTGQSQHEVLQNFFQSLLTNKDRAAASAGTRAAAAKANGAGQEDGTAS